MGLRVTNGMMSNLVTFNSQRSLARFVQMQSQMSSGRRINKPSDDPLGTLRDLDYRGQIKQVEQFRRNISVGVNWQQSYDTVLADVKDMMSSAKEIAVAMSNGTYDASARAAAAIEVRSIYDSIIDLANTELEGKYVFSGYRTDEKALAGSRNGAVYRGDHGDIDLEVESGRMLTTNLHGSDVFFGQLATLGADADLSVAVLGTTILADLNSGTGVDLTTGGTPGTIQITDQNLNITSTIDLAGAAVTSVQDALDAINTQLTADGITDITAKLGPANNSIMFEANPSGVVTSDTILSVLNDGNGVSLDPGKIVLRDGINPDLEIDLSAATTVGDVMAAFNAAAPVGVTMQIDPVDGKSLQINDTNGPPTLGLEVVDVDSGSTTGVQLGILGQIEPTLDGLDLNPTVSILVEETTGTTASDLGILGEFTRDFMGADLNPNLIATDSLASLNNAAGFDLGEIVIRQGEQSRIIDLSDTGLVTVQDLIDTINNSGLAVTASINAAGFGIQITNDDVNRTLLVEDRQPGTNIARGFGIYGSGDTLGSLLALANALDSNDEEAVRHLVGNMDQAIDHSITTRAQVGARWGQLETSDARQIDKDLAYTRLLAEVEDADMTRLISELATYENNFQAALMATAKIIQPSLLDFLR